MGWGKFCCFNGADNPDCILTQEDKLHEIDEQFKETSGGIIDKEK
jgi:hypothetical protein